MLTFWSVLLELSSAILIRIVKYKVVVLFVATFKIWTFYLKVRSTNFKYSWMFASKYQFRFNVLWL